MEDIPTVQISGLDPEQLVPPTPSPTSTPKERGDGSPGLPETPNSFGHSLNLDEEEVRRGMVDEDDDSDSEIQTQTEPPVEQQLFVAVGTTEEGVPPSSAVTGIDVYLEDEVWDDV